MTASAVNNYLVIILPAKEYVGPKGWLGCQVANKDRPD